MRRVSGPPAIFLLTAAGALSCAAPAGAAVRKITVRQGPLTVKPYEVRFTSRSTKVVRSPRVNGYLVRMHGFSPAHFRFGCRSRWNECRPSPRVA